MRRVAWILWGLACPFMATAACTWAEAWEASHPQPPPDGNTILTVMPAILLSVMVMAMMGTVALTAPDEKLPGTMRMLAFVSFPLLTVLLVMASIGAQESLAHVARALACAYSLLVVILCMRYAYRKTP